MIALISQHARSFSATVARLARAPLASVFSIVVIGIALSLPAGLYVIIDNLQASSRQMAAEPQISIFMALDANAAETAQIESRLKQNARVQRYRFVSRERALEELTRSSGIEDIVQSLPQNPLPDAFVLNSRESSAQALQALRDEVAQWPRVEHAQLDAAWARRLDASLRFARLAVWALAALLATALVAITFNTIRLQVLTQREEVEVIKLIGATDAFIRRPFLYYGAVQGLAGGVVAWLIVAGAVWLANRNLGELSHVYASLIQVKQMTIGETSVLFVLPLMLSLLGAWASVSTHLAKADASPVTT